MFMKRTSSLEGEMDVKPLLLDETLDQIDCRDLDWLPRAVMFFSRAGRYRVILELEADASSAIKFGIP